MPHSRGPPMLSLPSRPGPPTSCTRLSSSINQTSYPPSSLPQNSVIRWAQVPLPFHTPTDVQFCHFFHETASTLLVVPVDNAHNPWLRHLTQLALGKPANQDLLHDAFRTSLLSLSSFDLGLRLHQALQKPGFNMMYSVSGEHRATAWESLRNAWDMGLLQSDVELADLALGCIVLIATVDVSLDFSDNWSEPG